MILVKNYSDFETVDHSLILFKGEVDDIEHSTLNIETNESSSLTWPVIGGSFQALVELRPGQNAVELQCGKQTKSLRICYERIKRTRFVKLVYIVCSNSSGEFQSPEDEDCSVESARFKLSFGTKLLQCLTAKKLSDCGFESSTFSLEEDETGNVICHVFRSELTIEDTHCKNEQELWDHFAVELMNSELKSENCKFLAFLSSTRYQRLLDGEKPPVGHVQVRARTLGHVALGGGGLALIGTACLYTWPSGLYEFQSKLTDDRPVDTTRFMDESCNRSRLWSCYVSSLGASLHELAHTFDVGHSRHGIMGLGFHLVQQELLHSVQKSCCVCTRNAHFNEQLIKKDNQPSQKTSVTGFSIEPKLIQWTLPCLYCPDGPFWNPSAARILAFHKWFLTEEDNSAALTWESTHKGWFVKSTHGMVVAELRDASGLVVAFWYLGKSQNPPLSVHLPKGPLNWKCKTLIVQDLKGNLLKIELTSPLQKTLNQPLLK